jgi:hypothetical protein
MLKLDRVGYVPGEAINFQAEIQNITSRVCGTRVKLYMVSLDIKGQSHSRSRHESLTNHAQIGSVRREIDQFFGVSGVEIVPRTSKFRKWLSVDVSWMNVIRERFMRDMNVGRQCMDVNVRGFEPVPTHKHWRPTRVPHVVTHTWRINYAHRLMNYAH